MDTSALEALASMARVLRALAFERHPIVDRPVCCIELDGDAVLFDEAEIRPAADHAFPVVISTELPQFGHLPAIRLAAVCRLPLASRPPPLPTHRQRAVSVQSVAVLLDPVGRLLHKKQI